MSSALITGITGQDGAYLSKTLLEKGHEVFGLIDPNRPPRLGKLERLGVCQEIQLLDCSLRDKESVNKVIKRVEPDEIYNLAAESSVGRSFIDPIGTIEFNTMSVLNVLEAIKNLSNGTRFYQASSSEMYGQVANLPVKEETPMHPRSPYAVSKAAAHWTTVNYRESYDIFACCGVLFNHESFLREPTFFVKKIIQEALDLAEGKRTRIVVGNLDVRRDFGYSPRYVEAMYAMMHSSQPDDYLVCSGRSISLREILGHVLERTGLGWDVVEIDRRLFRPTEIADMFGDNTKARTHLGWNYDLDFLTVLDHLIDEEREARSA